MTVAWRRLNPEVGLAELQDYQTNPLPITELLSIRDFSVETGEPVSDDVLLSLRLKLFNALGITTDDINDCSLSRESADRVIAAAIEAIFDDFPNSFGFDRWVWAYIYARVVPDVAVWRWNPVKLSERAARDRFVNGPTRGFLQRLWHQHQMLGSDLMVKLTEDDRIKIFERPQSLGGWPAVAQATARQIVERRQGQRQALDRDLVKLAAVTIRRNLAVRAIHSMDQADVDELIREAFDLADTSLRR